MFDLREMAREGVLVAAHRGCWMGNIPCNTPMAFEAALAEGADIIELDISRSRDGTLYVFHPGMEKHFLDCDRPIADMTDAEVSALRLLNGDGAATQYAVPLFDDVLDQLRGRCVINIDKFPYYPREIVRAVRRHGMAEQALIKTKPEEACYRMVEELAPDFSYMVFAKEKDTATETLVKRSLRYLGTEALFSTEESEFAAPAYHEKMHRLGLLTWANAIVFDCRTVHSAGHTDDLYTMGQADAGWGYLAGLGYDIIQTDWVGPCIRYLMKNGAKKNGAPPKAAASGG